MTATAAPASKPRTKDHLDLRAVLIIIACCLCWAGGQVTIKIANTGISPVLHAGVRSILSGLLVFGWSYMRGIPLFTRDRTLWPGLTIGVMFSLEFMLLFWGLSYTTASRGVVFLYTAPFVVAFGAHIFVPGDRLTLLKTLGLFAALGGLLIAVRESFFGSGGSTLLGDMMCFGAAVLWGIVSLVARTSPLHSAPPEKTLLYQLAVSAVVLPFASLALGEAGITNLSAAVVFSVLYHAIPLAFVSFLAWYWLLRTYSPTRISSFTFLTPVFGVMAGNLILGEALTLSLVLALVLIAFGIALVNRPAPAAKTSP